MRQQAGVATSRLELGASDLSVRLMPNMAGDQLQGIRGWLLLFCLSMTMRPLITAYTLIALFPVFTTRTDPFAILLGYSLITTVFIGFGLYSAFLLWTVHKNAVITAKVYLVCFLIYWILLALSPFLLPSDMQTSHLATFFLIFQKQLPTAIGYFLIWFSYLCVSKRVANTYTPQASPTTP